MKKQKMIKSIITMLDMIGSEEEIERIHRFVQYIYIKR